MFHAHKRLKVAEPEDLERWSALKQQLLESSGTDTDEILAKCQAEIDKNNAAETHLLTKIIFSAQVRPQPPTREDFVSFFLFSVAFLAFLNHFSSTFFFPKLQL